MNRRNTILAMLVALLLGLAATPALAGKPSAATLSVTPNHAAAWSVAHGSGCGYAGGSEVYVDVHKPSALAFTSVMADANGCIAFDFTVDEPGTYLLEARQQGNGKKWSVLASYELPVV